MKFTRIPEDTFEKLQMNAGILARNFNPATGEVNDIDIIGSTSGGINFKATPTYKDMGEDVDNCPKNTLELKLLQSVEARMSGTFASVDAEATRDLVGAADIDANDLTHIVPRNDLLSTDYKDVWWIGDYSNVNTGENAGYMAIHLMNALNTGGFQIQSTDKEKGKFAFDFLGHYSIKHPDDVPFEIYIKGTSGLAPSIMLNKHSVNLEVNEEFQLTADVVPAESEVTWTSSAPGKVSVTSAGKIKGLEAGSAIITASITTEGGVTYTDTCTAVVSAG